MGKEGPKERLEMVSRSQHGQRRSQDRLEMISRKPTWAKKKDRLDG